MTLIITATEVILRKFYEALVDILRRNNAADAHLVAKPREISASHVMIWYLQLTFPRRWRKVRSLKSQDMKAAISADKQPNLDTLRGHTSNDET